MANTHLPSASPNLCKGRLEAGRDPFAIERPENQRQCQVDFEKG
jgi:hypothetical protein